MKKLKKNRKISGEEIDGKVRIGRVKDGGMENGKEGERRVDGEDIIIIIVEGEIMKK